MAHIPAKHDFSYLFLRDAFFDETEGTFIDLFEEFEVELGGVLTVEIYNCALLLNEEVKQK